MQISRNLPVAAALAVFVALFGLAGPAHAGKIRVAQESAAGLGDFDANVLGFVDPFGTALTHAQFYQYNVPNGASYNGELNGGPNPVSSLSQAFLVNASDGLGLYVVHDNPNDGSGGSTRTRWNLSGDPGASFVVVDDPGEGVVVSMGGTQFDSTKNWLNCCTDGYVISSLDGGWTMLGQFLTIPTGINAWSVVSSDFGSISLVLSPGRRVQLKPVPEPASLALMAVALVGMGVAARRAGARARGRA